MTPAERQTLWEQFVGVYSEAQKTYDSSVRTLAAAGAAITVSLATALEGLSGSGEFAVFLFLVSLGLNLLSYVTVQFDMNVRLACLREDRDEGMEGNRWTQATRWLNVLAGVALVAGGTFLAIFVERAA